MHMMIGTSRQITPIMIGCLEKNNLAICCAMFVLFCSIRWGFFLGKGKITMLYKELRQTINVMAFLQR